MGATGGNYGYFGSGHSKKTVWKSVNEPLTWAQMSWQVGWHVYLNIQHTTIHEVGTFQLNKFRHLLMDMAKIKKEKTSHFMACKRCSWESTTFLYYRTVNWYKLTFRRFSGKVACAILTGHAISFPQKKWKQNFGIYQPKKCDLDPLPKTNTQQIPQDSHSDVFSLWQLGLRASFLSWSLRNLPKLEGPFFSKTSSAKSTGFRIQLLFTENRRYQKDTPIESEGTFLCPFDTHCRNTKDTVHT